MSIPFTQYMMPNGRRVQVLCDSDSDTEKAAKVLVDAGCHFDIEMLMNGVISMTCEKEDDSGETVVLGHELCSNGPDVPIHVKLLVSQATKENEK